MKKNISISILNSGNPVELFQTLYKIKERMEKIKKKELFDITIHFDVMDQKFVKNKGVDISKIKIAKEMGFYVDTHLMVASPIFDKYIEDAIREGTNDLTIHYEIENFEGTLNYLNIRKNKILRERNENLLIGVAVKPNTPVEELLKYKDKFDKLLIMTVEPGLGGQSYLQDMNEKIKRARVLFDKHIIQVDGGINLETMEEPLRMGVNSFVMGMFLVKLNDERLYEKLLSLNIKKEIEEIPKDIDFEFEKRTLQIVPGGYAENDMLIGVNIPSIRKVANTWYQHINLNILDDYISSKYHEYRRFAIYTLSNMAKECEKNIIKNKNIIENKQKLKEINEYINRRIEYINNWDLTDEVGPNIIAKYLKYALSEKKREEEILKYLNSKNTWTKRIGIVSMLPFAKENNERLVFFVLDKVLYEEYHLFQKASGWVLRELYKVNQTVVKEYLEKKQKEKKLPSILLSYACEKMSKEEKIRIKEGNKI